MTEDKRKHGAWAQEIGILAVVVMIVGPALAHFGISPLTGLDLFLVAGLAGFIAMALAVVAAIRGGRRRAVVGLVLGAIPVTMILYAAHTGAGMPAINDITTDLASPPHFLETDHPYPAKFKAVVKKSYPNLGPVRVTLDPAKTYEAALALAKGWKRWKVVAEDPKAHVIQAVATTKLFRFKDDVVIRITAAPTGGSIVDMRSRSRVGKGDLGTNARRIRAFLDVLAAKLGGAVT